MAKKPVGWRPYGDEYRATLKNIGLSDEQIAEREAENVYAPNPAAIQALHLALAIAEAGVRHLGPQFATSVRAALDGRVDRLRAATNGEEDLVEAPMVEALAAAIDWEALIERASK